MSITDELRKYVQDWRETPNLMYDLDAGDVDGILADFESIADRIDAEHEKACDDEWDNGYEADYLGIESWLTEHPQVMEKHGWIRLPKDADGEYIHIGDRVENNERVVRIVLTDGSWEPSVYVEKLPNVLHEHFCNEVSHYHEPTVEDVLREMLYKAHIYDEREMELLPDLIEEYAAKLRLADGKE